MPPVAPLRRVVWHYERLALLLLLLGVPTIHGKGSAEAWGGTGLQQATAAAVDGQGNTWVVGYTDAADFPTLNTPFARGGGVDAFVVQLNASGTVLMSTYLGGAGDDRASGIGLDAAGNMWIRG